MYTYVDFTNHAQIHCKSTLNNPSKLANCCFFMLALVLACHERPSLTCTHPKITNILFVINFFIIYIYF
jgi:hypothetical protein